MTNPLHVFGVRGLDALSTKHERCLLRLQDIIICGSDITHRLPQMCRDELAKLVRRLVVDRRHPLPVPEAPRPPELRPRHPHCKTS